MGLDVLRENQLGHLLKFHIYIPFLPQGSKLSLISPLEQRYIAIFGHETFPLAKVPEVAYILSFYPMGLKLSLFSLQGQRFLRYQNLPYLEMKIRHWPKLLKLHIYSLSIPWGQNGAYSHSRCSGFRDTGQFSQLPYLGMKLGKWSKFQKLHIYPISTQGGRN